jgi:hypothetical protein
MRLMLGLQRLLPKLKTHLLEQEAKYAFMHFLIGEDAPDDDDMAELLAQIPPKKEALRAAKKQLTQDEATLIDQARTTNDSECDTRVLDQWADIPSRVLVSII